MTATKTIQGLAGRFLRGPFISLVLHYRQVAYNVTFKIPMFHTIITKKSADRV